MSFRKRTIEVTLRLTVDEYVNDKDPEASNHKFYWEENHCISNELELLGDHLKTDGEKGYCNICGHAEVKMLPLDAQEGYMLVKHSKTEDDEDLGI